METVRGPRAACADDPVIMTPLMHLTTLHICSGMPSICLMGQQGAANQSSLVCCACTCVCMPFRFSYLHCPAFNRCFFGPSPCLRHVVTLQSICFQSLVCVCVHAAKQTDTCVRARSPTLTASAIKPLWSVTEPFESSALIHCRPVDGWVCPGKMLVMSQLGRPWKQNKEKRRRKGVQGRREKKHLR